MCLCVNVTSDSGTLTSTYSRLSLPKCRSLAFTLPVTDCLSNAVSLLRQQVQGAGVDPAPLFTHMFPGAAAAEASDSEDDDQSDDGNDDGSSNHSVSPSPPEMTNDSPESSVSGHTTLPPPPAPSSGGTEDNNEDQA